MVTLGKVTKGRFYCKNCTAGGLTLPELKLHYVTNPQCKPKVYPSTLKRRRLLVDVPQTVRLFYKDFGHAFIVRPEDALHPELS